MTVKTKVAALAAVGLLGLGATQMLGASSSTVLAPGTYVVAAPKTVTVTTTVKQPPVTTTVTVTSPAVTVTTPATTTVPTTTVTPPPKTTGVAPPLPPSAYALPAGSVTVTSSAQLATALTGAAKTIVLADGTYDQTTPFSDSNGSSLYAQHLGRAVLTTGLVVGGNFGAGGATVRGLAFNLTDPSKAFQGGELQTWGNAGAGLHLLDTTFDGHGVVPIGLFALSPDGLIAQRLTFSHFTDEGIRASDNAAVPYGSPTSVIDTVSDIDVDGVTYPTPGDSNGTGEAGVWIGQPVTNGVQRIRVRNVSISGIETVNNSRDTTFSDLDVDMSGPNQSSGVGVYLEHYSVHDTFTNFAITARTGFNGEWDDGVTGNAAAHNDTIQNGTIDATGEGSHTAGIYLDEGSESTTVTGVTFKNQSWAAIGAYLNIGKNAISGNSYSLAPGASQLSTAHI